MVTKYKDYKGIIYYEVDHADVIKLNKALFITTDKCNKCNKAINKVGYYIPLIRELVCLDDYLYFSRKYKVVRGDNFYQVKMCESFERTLGRLKIKVREDESVFF